MERSVDTVVVGGGPAGAACALTLQKEGGSVLLIEKRAYPRPKTCGGLATEKTVALLRELLEGLPEAGEIEGVFCGESRVFSLWDGDRRLTLSQMEKPLRFVRRETFDAFLAGAYRSAGGELLENCTWQELDTEERVMILSNGDRVRYRHLVAADGALSETRAAAGGRTPPLGFCVETRVPAADLPLNGETRVVFGVVPTGYVWQFPSGDEVCVGLGGEQAAAERYDVLLRDYLASLGLDPDACPVRGAFLPYGGTADAGELPYGVLPVGDAGGFVDPVTGEGLYFALASGRAAAEAILAGGNVTRGYLRRTAPFARTVREGNWVRRFLYRPGTQKRFKRGIEGRSGFVAFYCDRQVAAYGYPYRQLLKLARDYRKGKR